MAATASSDSVSIATMIHMVTIKLSSSNFLLWKRQVIPMLTCFGLLGHVDGSSKPPAESVTADDGSSSPNPAFVTWHTTDQKLLGVLFSTLTEEAMTEVVDCTTSRAAWLALEAAFSHSSTSWANQLREELLSLRRGSLSVQDYGKRFKSICDQLSAIGRSVDESDKSHWFLRGLGIHFASFADTRMAMTLIPSFSDLLHQAVQFDLLHKSMDHSASQPTAAFTASTRTSNTGRGRGGFSPRNSTAGRGRGHSFSAGRGNFSAPRKPRCQICKGEHYADKCPIYLSKCNGSTADLAQVFHASCAIQPPAHDSGSDWYIDSSTSAHIAANPSALDSVETYNAPAHQGTTSSRPL